MELKDLQKAWSQFSASQAGKKELDEEQIRTMLDRRTKNLIERIDRNIRVGFVVIFLIILVLVLNDFILSPWLVEGIDHQLRIPGWLLVLDVGINVLIVSLFLLFVISYFRVRRNCSGTCDLRHTLLKTIRVLNFYRQLFALVLVIFLLASGTGFLVGLFQGIHLNGMLPVNLPVVIAVGMVFLLIITGGLFFAFRWIFRRLYGNYLDQLKQTLRELDELE